MEAVWPLIILVIGIVFFLMFLGKIERKEEEEA